MLHAHELFADDVAGVFAQQVINVVDRAGRRIFHRHHAVTRLAVRHSGKDLFKRLEIYALAVVAKETDHRALAVRARHAAVRNPLGFRLFFQIAPLLLAGETHDLREQRHHALRQRRIARLLRAGFEHGLLPRRVQDVHIMRLLVERHVAADAHAPLEQAYQLRVDFVNFLSAVFQVSHVQTPSVCLRQPTYGSLSACFRHRRQQIRCPSKREALFSCRCCLYQKPP